MFRKSIFLALALAAAPALAVQAQQVLQAQGTPATGPYTHPASGITFPATLGEFRRVKVERPAEGSGVDVLYALITPAARIGVTILVEKMPPEISSCAEVATAFRGVVLQDHPDAVFTALTPPPIATYTAAGFSARYKDTSPYTGGSDQHFYCGGGWVVTFDFIHAPDLDAAAQERAFLAALALPRR
ncbi:MAG TPA: hypothetical protein VJ798_08820 [Rhizomicrobium sp.]|nr:hypothetical protein [Rhizomicrobium sp.]